MKINKLLKAFFICIGVSSFPLHYALGQNVKITYPKINITNIDLKNLNNDKKISNIAEKKYPEFYYNDKKGKYANLLHCQVQDIRCFSNFSTRNNFININSSQQIQNMLDDKLIKHIWIWDSFQFIKNSTDSNVYFLDNKGNIFKHNYIDNTQLIKIISTAELQGVGITRLNHIYNYPLSFFVSFSAIMSLLFMPLLVIWIIFALKRFLLSPADVISAKGMPSFNDIAGNDYIKNELKVIAKVFKDGPSHPRFKLIPKGVLLLGPPGNGKTLIASALAHEINGGFISVNGADFVEMFAGLGPRRVKATFKKAQSYGNCVVFIDEIDAIGKNRQLSNNDSASQEWVNTLNKLLECIDGISGKKELRVNLFNKFMSKFFPTFYSAKNSRVIVVGATNRGEILDPALTRSGRLEKSIYIPLPDCKVREEIAKIHLRKEKIDSSLDFKAIAMSTAGMSGSDIQFLCKEAKIASMNIIQHAKENGLIPPDGINMEAFNDALDLKLLGPKCDYIVSEKELMHIAVHESGHALIAMNEFSPEYVRRITIEPRGNTLGFVAMAPTEDKKLQTLHDIIGLLRIQVAGRVAEEIIFGKNNITTGAVGDIQQATELARQMVMDFGLSKTVGMVKITNDFSKPISEKMRATVDEAIKQEIDEAIKYTQHILMSNKDGLKSLASSLIIKNTQSGYDIAKYLKQVNYEEI